MTAARNVLAELVFHRVEDSVDFNGLILFEDELAQAISAAGDACADGLDAASLMDGAWARVETRWREMRARANQDAGDHEHCPLCPPPGVRASLELDLEDANPVFCRIDPRALRHGRG